MSAMWSFSDDARVRLLMKVLGDSLISGENVSILKAACRAKSRVFNTKARKRLLITVTPVGYFVRISALCFRRNLNRIGFSRHLEALKSKTDGGVDEQQAQIAQGEELRCICKVMQVHPCGVLRLASAPTQSTTD
ncbi:hypothetical protein [Uliginosibacterium gangwonense]|uniref:hypothetical protein n=1 Tax=Uliginosibacterium gangwonense TaxID=392736 RepID=UPI0012FB48D8|nr:hypothetical protein [Uliginosibacterium gangwonense]